VSPTQSVKVFKDTYLDSVLQLMGTRAMEAMSGVDWAAVAMATSANLTTLAQRGFAAEGVAGAAPGDLFIAVEAADEETAAAATAEAESAMFSARQSRTEVGQAAPRSLDEALVQQPGSNIAVISVPGDYGALEAHKALARGLDVLLFSDNVSRQDEIALKEHARMRDRLLMGPGAGTAMLGGIGLAFANVVKAGPVGVIAAAGTGAQEAMALLDRWGVGVSHVIGLGGRDLNEDIGGRMARMAIEYLRNDPATHVILFVSKPPSPAVARDVLSLAEGTPLVAAFMGVDKGMDVPAGVVVTDTLEGGVVEALEALGQTAPDPTSLRGPSIETAISRVDPRRTTIRGLYSGGTLCYEALVLLGRHFGAVHSNTPVDKKLGLPAPDHSSVLLDLGEEEYTKGRPHPMIDPQARVEMLEELLDDSEVAVILMDVVLGYGSHPDPAGVLAPVCARLMTGGGPQVVTYVLGTEGDPQDYASQVRSLVDAGCIVTETAARAALVAAGIAARKPEIASVAL
jgi:FdrA protein